MNQALPGAQWRVMRRGLARDARACSPTLAGATRRTAAGTYVTINGSGSSWSEVALDQWSQDVQSHGLDGQLQPRRLGGRARRLHGQDQDDFAASDPPFRNGHDQLAGTGAEIPSYGYSYIPDTAGGTAFMYHLDVGGKLITNMRLSPKTLMEIFTGQITNWDDKRDHQGLRRPAAEHADHPGGPVRRLGRDVLLHPLDVAHVPVAVERVLLQGPPRGSAPPAGRPSSTRLVRQRQGRERLQQRRHLHHLELRQRRHRLRRVRLRAQLALPGGQGAEPGRLLRAAHRLQRGRRADQGADQRGPAQRELPPAEPGQRLHLHRPAVLPAVQLQLPDRARSAPSSRPPSATPRASRSARTSTTSCAPGSNRSIRSATRRCRRTWSRAGCCSPARSPVTSPAR